MPPASLFAVPPPNVIARFDQLNPKKHHNRAIAVIAIGGAHQQAHIVPVALEFERRFPGAVTIYVLSSSDRESIGDLAIALGQPLPRIVELTLPRTLQRCLPKAVAKTARLIFHFRKIARANVILCAERTSTVLRKVVRDLPPLWHIPHGAGDRAVGFEKRFAKFDGVLLAGRKDRDRLVASGRVSAASCIVTGPIKLASYLWQGAPVRKLFDNDRPTLLYNPHFIREFRSFDRFARRMIEAVVADGRFNLIVAPHVRLGAQMSRSQKRYWQAFAVPGQIIVDLGSPCCNDMTYTAAADLYIGDVSSQVYEFLIRPRPCLFVDVNGVDWRANESYAMWHFGEVIGASADPIGAIERAFANHNAYVRWQRERMTYAIEGIAWTPDGKPYLTGPDPIRVAADHLERQGGAGAPYPYDRDVPMPLQVM